MTHEDTTPDSSPSHANTADTSLTEDSLWQEKPLSQQERMTLRVMLIVGLSTMALLLISVGIGIAYVALS